MEQLAAFDVKAYPTCKICDRGALIPRHLRRLSGPAVAIGYILLIPSILGMVSCAILLAIIFFVPAMAPSYSIDAAVMGTGIVVAAFVGCFVSGLLGWLLIMKKHVLQCDNCGAVVNASKAITLNSTWNFEHAGKFALCFLLFLVIIGLIAAIMRTPSSVPAATTTDSTQTEIQKGVPREAITASIAMQPFISSIGRFSAVFPATPEQSSGQIDLGNGEKITLYKVSVNADSVKYAVTYGDCPPDAIGASPQAFLQGMEKAAIADKTFAGAGDFGGDYDFDLNGVPGRAFTVADSYGTAYDVREYLAGTRFYSASSTFPVSMLGSDHGGGPGAQFMNSFKIF